MREKVLILGSNGLLGNTLLRYFLRKKINVKGVLKNKKKNMLQVSNYYFSGNLIKNNKIYIKNIEKILKNYNPDFVINCIGITKVKRVSNKTHILINSLLPKKLNILCNKNNIRLVHFSTDCVFDGSKGFYNEKSKPNAKDIYGISKYKGEFNTKKAIIFRTSMIGHSIIRNNGLLEWFLNQKKIRGFANAYFSGPTALEIAKILYKYVINKNIIKNGIFHLGVNRISKYDLLNLINNIYKRKIIIKKNFNFKVNRSLNSNKFYKKTKYKIPTWKRLITEQKKFWIKENKYV